MHKTLRFLLFFLFSFILCSQASSINYKSMTLEGTASKGKTIDDAVKKAVAVGICEVNNIQDSIGGGCKMAQYNSLLTNYPPQLNESNGGFRNIEILEEGKDFLGQIKVTVKAEIAVWSVESMAAHGAAFDAAMGTNMSSMGQDLAASLGIDQALEMQNSTVLEFLRGSADFNRALVIIFDAYGMKKEVEVLKAQQNFLETGDMTSSNFNSNMKQVSVIHAQSVDFIAGKIKSGAELDSNAKQKLSEAYTPFYSGLAKTSLAVFVGIQNFNEIKGGSDNPAATIANLISLGFIVNEVATSLPRMIKASNLLIKYGEDNNIPIPDEVKKQQQDINSLGFV